MSGRSATPLLLLLAPAALVTWTEPARAQSCGGSAGTCIASGASSEASSSWPSAGHGGLRLSEEYEVKDRFFKGAHRVSNDFDETLFSSRTSLDLRCGVTDDWAAELTATYPHFTYRVRPPGAERIKQRFRGPGDTFLSFGRRVAGGDDAPEPSMPTHEAPDRAIVSLWGGVSLPTGSPERPDPARVDQDVSVANLQTGTGTFDPFVRARFERPLGRWTLFGEADVLYPLYENRFRYRTGDTEALVVGASTPLLAKLSASCGVMFQRVARDEFRAHPVGVGGARTAYLLPALTWRVSDAAALEFGVRVPFYRRTETKLSDSNVVFQIALTYAF